MARRLTRLIPYLAIPAVLWAAWASRGVSSLVSNDLEGLAKAALTGSPLVRPAAVARLRALGPAGLEALLTLPHAKPAARAAVDAVAAQRDASASELYWYTDMEAARAAAMASGRPILTLRLLGRLDEELSCANSRFFRTVLYPDAAVSRALREEFVLHWQSVRPVPRLTVDFGDGRTLETTITGNSIHYVLTPDGQPVDALPGLWGAQAFLDELERGGRLAREVASLPPEARRDRLATHHAARVKELEGQLAGDLAQTEAARWTTEQSSSSTLVQPASGLRKDDLIFSTGTFVTWPEGSKAAVELPLIRSVVTNAQPTRGTIDDATWSAIAQLHADECRLDERSRGLAREKELRGDALGAEGGERIAPLLLNLERSVAEDTVRIRYVLHRAVAEWFAAGEVPSDVDALNERVYRELFHSTGNDGWLGLVPPDTYRGLDGGGLQGGARS